jgi:hypothetical protein
MSWSTRIVITTCPAFLPLAIGARSSCPGLGGGLRPYEVLLIPRFPTLLIFGLLEHGLIFGFTGHGVSIYCMSLLSGGQ